MKGKVQFLFSRAFALVLAILILLPILNVRIFATGEIIIPENLAMGKNVTANNHYQKNHPMTMAVDGSTYTHWRSLSTCEDGFIYLIVPFEAAVDIGLIRVILYEQSVMNSVKLQYTADPNPSAESPWEDIKAFARDELSPEMTIKFDTVRATGVRFYAEVSAHPAGLYELEIYEPSDYRKFTQNDSVDAKIVSVGEKGELIYADYDGVGGKLIDFSYAGYKNGNEPIPDVKVVKTIDANYRENHTVLIQNAIDEVAALPLEQRGAILLKAGKYTVSDQIKISASGIVLRGEGQGENGTVIYDARNKYGATTLSIYGTGSFSAISGTKTQVAVDYVPMGSAELKLSNVGVYDVGDTVCVTCVPNDLWVQTLGMDVIPGETAVQWKASEYVLTYERWITDIDAANGTVTLNTGLPLTLDKKYYSATVEKIQDSAGRISECGIENIRFVSYYNGSEGDDDHPWNAVSLARCRNCFVRDVTAKHYVSSTVVLGEGSINITVDGCSYLEPISLITGSRRYSFKMTGCQYALVKNCYSYEARHDYALGSRICGPNVFLDSIAENANAACEPHQRWSTGVLYDNIYVIGSSKLGYIQLINRGKYGTGHGWACANSVMWNCLAPALNVGKPQTEQNFAVGVYGIYDIDKEPYLHGYKQFVTPTVETPNYPETQIFEGSPMHGNGYIESPYNPVDPSSLYKAQLSYRLYGDATKNVVPSAPILNYPIADAKSEVYSLAFGGVCDKNAEKVYVYVNGEKHEADIAKDGSNDYTLTLDLENGYYDVSVTQVIDGIESRRNAIRTVLVDAKDPYVPKDETDKPEDAETEPKDTEPEPKDTEPKPTETTALEETDNKTDNISDNDKKINGILAVLIIIGAVAAAALTLFFVKKKQSKQ